MSVLREWGMCCPACGDDTRLTITLEVDGKLTAEGTKPVGDHHWDMTSGCGCGCGWVGTVADAAAAGMERVNVRIREDAMQRLTFDEADISIAPDAPVEKVEGGYWVEAKIFVLRDDIHG